MSEHFIALYAEADIFCLCILLYIIIKSFGHTDKRHSWPYFKRMIYGITLLVAFDLIWKLMEYGALPSGAPLPYLVNCLYYLCTIVSACSWFFYTEAEMDTGLVDHTAGRLACTLPSVIIVILLAVSYFNGCLFYFDGNGYFHRGPLNMLTFLIPCGYLLFSVFRAMTRALQKQNYAYRKNYMTLSHFSWITIISSALQVLVPGTPLPCIGMTVASLFIYTNSQELQISLDPLTKLNNRYHMIQYLSYKMQHRDQKNNLYLMIVDLDKFKEINDTYGHIEGDYALIRMADALRKTASIFHCFVSRYAGDEFVIIHETPYDADIPRIYRTLRETLNELNAAADSPYEIRFSIGCAKYHEGIRYVPDFVKLADQSLYRVKEAKKKTS